jgi:DNA polymerase III subunit gamma/tau
MSWYRTYRPQTISALHIVSVRETLLKMLKSGNIPQALLFTGPKGTGKTSSARIIAKVLNCEKNAKRKAGSAFVEPCNTCQMCLEITSGGALHVVEMDGASNRRIDDIRQLKEQVYMPPASGQKSVYIIDEVHMLTKEAFNALLKMLEEPPEHAVFIFATTDPQKIPETILSRATRVQFTRATLVELVDALSQIAKKEGIAVQDTSLELIAQTADGSFRDAVKLFEQLAHRASADSITITPEWVSTHLSSISADGVKKLLQSILVKDERAIISFFQTIRDQQIDPLVIHKQLLSFLHSELVKALTTSDEPFASKQVLMFLLKQFSAVEIPMMHPFPSLPLELCAIEMVLKSKEKASGGGSQKVTVKPQAVITNKPPVLKTQSTSEAEDILPKDEDESLSVETITEVKVSGTAKVAVPARVEASTIIEDAIHSQADSIDGSIVGERWNDLLKHIGRHNLSLEAILRSAQFASGEYGKATIKVFYSFHKEQLELQRYRTIIEKAIQEVCGGHVRFEYVLSAPSLQKVTDDNVRGNVDKEFVNVIEEALM